MKHRIHLFKRGIMIMLLLFVLSINANSQTIYYVDSAAANNNGTGKSWSQAWKSLDTALLLATFGDQVWVKKGTFIPAWDHTGNANPSDDKSKTFYVRDGVKLYGGFAGNETNIGQRATANNKTILNGDLGSSKVYHVLVASATSSGSAFGVTIDGFVVSNGSATGSTNININGNSISTQSGGGLYIIYGNNKINDIEFTGNTAESGGAIMGYYGVLSITKCNIHGNSANADGGAVYFFKLYGTITHNVFSKNNSAGTGGAILDNQSVLLIKNNIISDNYAKTFGAGLRTYFGTDLIKNNTISGNTAGADGGGFYNEYGDIYIAGNTISQNIAGNQGGGILNNQSKGNIYNNVITDNSAKTGGGAFLYYGTDSFNNNTLFGNTSTANGGGLHLDHGYHEVNNNIFWENMLGSQSNQNRQ